MAQGRLTQTEKYTIQGMLHSKKTTEEIAELTGRTVKCIENYVKGELDQLHNTITQVQLDIAGPTPDANVEVSIPPVVKPDVIKLNNVPKGQAKRTMVHKTFGGKDGVVVMTPGASQVGDEFAKQLKTQISRTSKGNLFDTEGNKIE